MDEKQEKIKKLTRKYFIEQKAKEIGTAFLWAFGVVLVIGIFISLLAFIGYLVTLFGWDECPPHFLDYSVLGMIPFMLLMVTLLSVYSVYGIIKEWLQDNWKKAKAKAEKEANE